MDYAATRYAAYKEASVNTASPLKLVVMLYEGAIRFLRQSIEAIHTKDLAAKRESINRAVAIVQHLQSTLDFSQGEEISKELDTLYTYTMEQILLGSARLDEKNLYEAIKILSTLLSAWDDAARKESENGVPPELLIQNSGRPGLQLHG